MRLPAPGDVTTQGKQKQPSELQMLTPEAVCYVEVLCEVVVGVL